jgi:hypothetical protein
MEKLRGGDQEEGRQKINILTDNIWDIFFRGVGVGGGPKYIEKICFQSLLRYEKKVSCFLVVEI